MKTLFNIEAIEFYKNNSDKIGENQWNRLRFYLGTERCEDGISRSVYGGLENALKNIEVNETVMLEINPFFGLENPFEGRYLTRQYQTTTKIEALRLAEVDGTKESEIKFTPNVKPIHVKSHWAIWSDGFFSSKCTSFPEQVRSLSADAQKLVNTVDGADCGSVEGGISQLFNIKAIVKETEKAVIRTSGHFANPSITEIECENNDGSKIIYYAVSAGYFEGYQYDIFTTYEKAVESFNWFVEK